MIGCPECIGEGRIRDLICPLCRGKGDVVTVPSIYRKADQLEARLIKAMIGLWRLSDVPGEVGDVARETLREVQHDHQP